jgi:hypothetical protein
MSQTISRVLDEHADDDVHIERLLAAVHVGVRRRRQRRAAVVGASLLVMATLAGVTGAVPSLTTAGRDADGSRPPIVAGQPTLAQAPQVLGKDRSLFHLDVNGADRPADWWAMSWSSRSGHEELLIDTDADDHLVIEADHDANKLSYQSGATSRVTVNGQPAAATTAPAWYAVRWQPIPGLWAQAHSTVSLAAAIDLARRLRLDHVYRCAVPFRLSAPATARLVKCQTTTYLDGTNPAATVWFRISATEPEYQVSSYIDQPAVVTNITVGGRAVRLNHPQPTASTPLELEIIYPYGRRTAYFWGFEGTDEATLRSAVTGFDPVRGENPAAWPSSPFRK